ncbi:hypothetical protein HAX54_019937 [Datura stramonium]|uniref:Uncharacterized protein n=1 Tax=Datura stramonium TaxID=4076 RepID=A0ABS8US28_DATST|nr:hypothetical protein [Datura stramonium]
MRVKTDLDKSLKWTCSSKVLVSANTRFGRSREDPHSEQAKPSDQVGQDRGVELKSSGQEPDTQLDTPRNDSQWDSSTNNTNHSQKEGSNNEETPNPATPISQQIPMYLEFQTVSIENYIP